MGQLLSGFPGRSSPKTHTQPRFVLTTPVLASQRQRSGWSVWASPLQRPEHKTTTACGDAIPGYGVSGVFTLHINIYLWGFQLDFPPYSIGPVSALTYTHRRQHTGKLKERGAHTWTHSRCRHTIEGKEVHKHTSASNNILDVPTRHTVTQVLREGCHNTHFT